MKPIVMTQHVDAPVEIVFEVAIDLPRAAEHIQGIEKIEMLTPMPVSVGTKWRETRIMFRREATEEFTVTAFDPPRSYTAGGESCGAPFEFRFDFTPAGDGTQVTMTLAFGQSKSLLAKLMAPLGGLMMGSCKKAIRQDLLDMKQAAEARCTPA